MKKLFFSLMILITILSSSETKNYESPPYVKIEITGAKEASQNLNKTSKDFLIGIKEITKIIESDKITEKDKKNISEILEKVQKTLNNTNLFILNMNKIAKEVKVPSEKYIKNILNASEKKLTIFKDDFRNGIVVVLVIFLLILILLLWIFFFNIKKYTSDILPVKDLIRSIDDLTKKLDDKSLKKM